MTKKYVVLARDKESGEIVDSFGVYTKYSNAKRKLLDVADDNYEYCIENADSLGSFADVEPQD